MIERPIPTSGERIPVIGLGTWQTFDVGPAAHENLGRVLDRFTAAGGRVIDSSPMYGKAESTVGELRAHAPHAFLATKVWTRGRDAGIAQMEESMRRMRAEVIDLMQIHNLVDWRTHLATLRRWKDEGRIRYLGITHYQTGAFAQLEELMRGEELDFVQLPLSVEVPDATRRLLPLARERGIAVLVNRPFEEGALLRRLRGRALPAELRALGCATWSEALLRWIVSYEEVTCVIPATSSVDHMANNLRAGEEPVWGEAERRVLIDALR